MKIESITIREIQMPLVHFFETSFGRTTGRRIILVTVRAQGITAWSECVAGEHPHYSDESVGTAWYALTTELAPAVIGKQLDRAGDCVRLMSQIRGHRIAKASIEDALSAAQAETKHIPLWKLLS